MAGNYVWKLTAHPQGRVCATDLAWWRLAGECICDAGTPPRGAPAGRPTNLEMKVQEGFCATAGKRRPQIRFATAQG
jgi:hypothetical protein